MADDLTNEKLRPVIANYESVIKHKDARIKELEENSERSVSIFHKTGVARKYVDIAKEVFIKSWNAYDNKTRLSNDLGVGRATLYRKARQLRLITPPTKEGGKE